MQVQGLPPGLGADPDLVTGSLPSPPPFSTMGGMSWGAAGLATPLAPGSGLGGAGGQGATGSGWPQGPPHAFGSDDQVRCCSIAASRCESTVAEGS